MSSTINAVSNQNGKRGRKSGSSDAVFVTIETLLKYIKPTTVIPVRRKFIEQIEAVNQIKFVSENLTKAAEVILSEVIISEENAAAKVESIRPHLQLEEETL